MDQAILDSDTLSEVLRRKHALVLAAARQYLAEHQRFAFSMFTVYEIMRGLQARQAQQQLIDFQALLATSDIYPVNTSVLMRAAALWVSGRRAGHPHNDADLIIAATALESGRVLVTGNQQHFDWIPALRLSDWRTWTP